MADTDTASTGDSTPVKTFKIRSDKLDDDSWLSPWITRQDFEHTQCQQAVPQTCRLGSTGAGRRGRKVKHVSHTVLFDPRDTTGNIDNDTFSTTTNHGEGTIMNLSVSGRKWSAVRMDRSHHLPKVPRQGSASRDVKGHDQSHVSRNGVTTYSPQR